MEQQFEATLTGSDTPVDGIVNKIKFEGYGDAYEFKALDDSLYLIIAKDDEGHWVRVTGSEPYLSGWVEELLQQIV